MAFLDLCKFLLKTLIKGLLKLIKHIFIDFDRRPATEDQLTIIIEDNFPILKQENENKISDKEEEELLYRIKEKIPQKIILKSRLKHYLKRYREEKRPSFSLFKAYLRVLELIEVSILKLIGKVKIELKIL